MSKPDQHKALSERFDREAESGFGQVPGSEAFFKDLKNPFTQKKYRVVNRAGSKKFLVFEIILMGALLLLLKVTWMKEETPAEQVTADQTAPVQKTEQKIALVQGQKEPLLVQVKKQSPQKQLPLHLLQKSYVRPVETDSSVQVATLPIEKKETVPVDSALSTPASVYHYADYRPYYKLRYQSDLLIVDYGDSITRLKLRPILDGTPASIESREQWRKMKEKEDPFITVTENVYLQKLEKGTRPFAAAEWTSALNVFQSLAKENPQDQNALFYGALCLYETGQYKEAFNLLKEMEAVEQPIFEQDADYYMALCLVKSGHAPQALERLRRIAGSDSYYRNKAALLVQELR